MTTPLRRALAGLAATALAAAGIVVVAGPALAAEVCPHGDGWTKVEAAGESTTITVTAPAGTVIVQTCVKAATDIAYATVDPGQATVTLVTPASNGRGVPQAISHYAYRTAPAPTVEEPSTPETPSTPPAPETPSTPPSTPSTPPAPQTPSTPETPSTPATPSTPETGVLAGGGAAPVAAPSVPVAAPVAAATADELAATGVEGWQIALALLLVAVGGGFVALSRRARHS